MTNEKIKAALEELKSVIHPASDEIYGGSILSSDGLHIVLSKDCVDVCLALLEAQTSAGEEIDDAVAFWNDPTKDMTELGWKHLQTLKKAALTARKVDAQTWQKIETAPKDGTRIFVWTGKREFSRMLEASWRKPTGTEYWAAGSEEPNPEEGTFGEEEGWFDGMGYCANKLEGERFPTHWMPLPSSPASDDGVK